ncbi:MAG: cupin domain-containing protein [Candidatus Helarchaeota archaeon]
MKIVDEKTIETGTHLSKWLLGPWNSESHVEFGIAILQPNQRVPLHYHNQVEELFYVIKGQVTLSLSNGQSHLLSKGMAVHIPPTLAHALQNHANTLAKLVVIKYPSIPSDKIPIDD